jgi:hypothetical protein
MEAKQHLYDNYGSNKLQECIKGCSFLVPCLSFGVECSNVNTNKDERDIFFSRFSRLRFSSRARTKKPPVAQNACPRPRHLVAIIICSMILRAHD